MKGISVELHIGDLPGNRSATEIIDEIEKTGEEIKVSLEITAYNSDATEPGEGCVLEIHLEATGEEREKTEEKPYGGYHRVYVHASLDKAQARALRDHINVFLELA